MKCTIESKFEKGAVLVVTYPQLKNNSTEKLKIVDIKLTPKKDLWYCFEYLCEREDRSRSWYLESVFNSDYTVEEIKS